MGKISNSKIKSLTFLKFLRSGFLIYSQISSNKKPNIIENPNSENAYSVNDVFHVRHCLALRYTGEQNTSNSSFHFVFVLKMRLILSSIKVYVASEILCVFQGPA